jgi:hypothetical protein
VHLDCGAIVPQTACGVSNDRAPDRETIIPNLLSGQCSNALCVVAFKASEGWSRDVSEDVSGEVRERAFDADDNLSDDTKRFIEWRVIPGESDRRRSRCDAIPNRHCEPGDEGPARDDHRGIVTARPAPWRAAI